MSPISPPRAVVFDLDGTLLDTLDDIASAANSVLAGEGFAPHPHEAFRFFIGDGVPTLFRRALPAVAANPARIDRCVALFQEAYAASWNNRTRPYDGILELLETLAQRSLPMAVLSNKPHEFTRKCVEHYFPRLHFTHVIGDRPGVPRKPDPASAIEIAADLGLDPAHVLYLGDSSVDMTTASRAGMIPIGASWGFRSTAELLDTGASSVIDHPSGLLRHL